MNCPGEVNRLRQVADSVLRVKKLFDIGLEDNLDRVRGDFARGLLDTH